MKTTVLWILTADYPMVIASRWGRTIGTRLDGAWSIICVRWRCGWSRWT